MGEFRTREKITWGLWVILPPKCKKRALKNKKGPMKIALDSNVKACSMLLVTGMWKVSPEI